MKEQSQNKSSSQFLQSDAGKAKSNSIEVPSIALPKGGGAIKGIDEKFSVNAVNGTAAFSIPLPFSPARGASPSLSLSYNSGSGNGIFGLGWNLDLPSIKRKTDKGLPQYSDDIDSDTYLFSGAEDLVPLLIFNEANKKWECEAHINRNLNGISYKIKRYKPRIEGLFARIECWTETVSGKIKWRVITKDNVTTLFGWSDNSVIADPKDEMKIFEWLPEFVFDDKGNCSQYIYKEEDDIKINPLQLHNKNRLKNGKITYTNRYLQRVLYGNVHPYKQFGDTFPETGNDEYLFETVFDYGTLKDNDSPEKINTWDFRTDAFSDYRAGFEIRTTRLCNRVLIFHVFAELALKSDKSDKRTLVKSINFDYDTTTQIDFTFLKSITSFGYIKKAGGYSQKNLPPAEFTYQKHDWNSEVKTISSENLVHAPAGLDEGQYQFTDLFNEGLSGILTEQAGAWYYKHNLSRGRFAQAKLVSPKPSFTGLGSQLQLADLDASGGKQLVNFSAEPKGYFEFSDEEEWQPFRIFQTLPNINFNDGNTRMLDLNGDGKPDLLMTEENVFTWYESAGKNGFTNIHRTAKPYDEEAGPNIVFADSTQSIFLADMSGDGLSDIVRIRNGEVCYWPNLGFGKFGTKVGMDDSPWFDHPDAFNPSYLRLADIDGSGTTDIVYLGKNKFICWSNLSGNSFSKVPFEIEAFPEIHNNAKVTVADLLGNGVACIVWSSPLGKDANSPLRYIDLMNSRKPHIMLGYKNNLGKKVSLEYKPSTCFYIEDKLAGKPWVTKLHFPVHCVSKTTVKDSWRKSTFSSSYSYHHGYYDHNEREFRGFGRVEQTDVEDFGTFASGNVSSPYITDDHTLYQPPVKTITWYHTGACTERDRILNQFQHEFFAPGSGLFTENTFPEPDIADLDLNPGEWCEALRACKGMMLRQEVYELDVDAFSNHEEKRVKLFSTAFHNCHIKCLQPRAQNLHAVFLVTESEAITYNYELDLRQAVLSPDPRIAHSLNLCFDDYGRALQTVAVVYPRQVPFSEPVTTLEPEQLALIRKVQNERHVACTETHFTAELPDDPDQHRLPAPCEVLTYELTSDNSTNGFAPASGHYFSRDDLRAFELSDTLPGQGTSPVRKLDYRELPTDDTAHKRIVEWVRILYFEDDLSKAKAFGEYAWIGLPYETYKLALTSNLLDAVFGAKLTADVLTKLNTSSGSGYEPGTTLDLSYTGQWWIRSGIAGFADDAVDHFYLPEKYTDPFGNETRLSYDKKYDLFIQSSTDASGNTSGLATDAGGNPRFDYRVLAPIEMVDVNGNHSEVAVDILGLVVASAIKGKKIGTDQWEGDDLTNFDLALCNPSPHTVQVFCFDTVANRAQARQWLDRATTRFVYHFGDKNGKWEQIMAGACAIVRERHQPQVDLDPNTDTERKHPIQIALECSDGTGNVLMKKVQAEPDSTLPIADQKLRWIINGLTVLNNKGKPVKQYEPAFSPDFGCEMPQANGVTPIMYYDAAGRMVRTEMPDGTFSKVEFSPWQVETFDANDTVAEPGNRWYAEKSAATSSTEDKRAARLASEHANTPAQVHLDSLGREVIAIAHNRSNGIDEKYLTFTRLDAEGKPLWIKDARGSMVMQYVFPYAIDNRSVPQGFVPCYDIAGNLLFQHSMDAGDSWMLMDAAGKPMLSWDCNERQFGVNLISENRLCFTRYDALNRPLEQWLSIDNGAPRMTERFEYQDGQSNDTMNLNGQLVLHYDPSGLVEMVRRDFNGNVLEIKRRLNNQPTESLIDWKGNNPAAKLEPETFSQLTEYDALNRMTMQYNWHREEPGKPVAKYVPGYNERGLLLSEQLTTHLKIGSAGIVNGPKTITTTAIKEIRYNVKGQKELLKLGNGTITRYDYDDNTFRLRQLRTTCLKNGQTEPPFPDFRSNLIDGRVLQQLHYTYDPVGNITEIYDEAYEPVFFKNQQVEPRSRYIYDSLYRLIGAEGREGFNPPDAPTQSERAPQQVNLFPLTNQTLRNYSQRYVYDSVGNILQMRHIAAQGNWHRRYDYATDSNRLLHTWEGDDDWNSINSTNKTSCHYDTHGNILNLADVAPDQYLQWDHRDMISSLYLVGGGMAYYQYDTGKQRTRKRIVKNATGYWERIYLGGYELYRRYNGTTLVEEIESHHLFEGEQRILLVDDVIVTSKGLPYPRPDGLSVKAQTLFRYQYANHLGSACLELDEQADIISYEEYHPYGTSAYRAMKNGIEAPPKRYRYTGMERDEESGLSYHTARYYLPWLGRWASCDPFDIIDSTNLYSFVRANPISFSDENGHYSKGGSTTSPEYFTTKLRKWAPLALKDRIVSAGATGEGLSYEEKQLTIMRVFIHDFRESDVNQQIVKEVDG